MEVGTEQFARLLEVGHALILADWARRVKDDPRVPADEATSNPSLYDHMPALLAAIIARLRTSSVTVASIEHEVGRGNASHEHANDRFQARYNVSAVIREFAHLRAAILGYLRSRGVHGDAKSEDMLHAALDEALSTAAVEIARQQQEMLAAVIEQSDDGIVAVDEHGHIRLFNRAASMQRGVKARDVGPGEWTRAYGMRTRTGEPLPHDESPLYRAMRGERVSNMQWQVQRPDGSVRLLVGNATPLSHADGTPSGAVLISRDETERVRDERRRDLLARFSPVIARNVRGDEMVQQLLSVVVPDLADVATVDTVASDGSLERSGMAAAMKNTAFMQAASRHVPSSAAESPIAQVVARREPMVVTTVTDAFLDSLAGADATYRRLLAEIHPVSFLLVPLIVRDRPIGVLKLISTTVDRAYEARDLEIAIDLADRAALAIDNARAYHDAADRAERLRQEVSWRERFMAMLSHDLRTPLSAIRLTGESLGRDASLNESQRAGAKRIVRATERATRMIADLLDVARARGGVMAIERSSANLTTIAEQVIEEIAKVFPEGSVQLVTRHTCDGEFDAGRIAQLIDNLVTNAVRYATPGTPVVVDIGESAPGVASIRVTNQGPPVPSDAVPTLFEPFKRSRNEHTNAVAGSTRGSGLGLGLYIASQIAIAHGGTLTLDHSDERGTSFVAVLPCAAA